MTYKTYVGISNSVDTDWFISISHCKVQLLKRIIAVHIIHMYMHVLLNCSKSESVAPHDYIYGSLYLVLPDQPSIHEQHIESSAHGEHQDTVTTPYG